MGSSNKNNTCQNADQKVASLCWDARVACYKIQKRLQNLLLMHPLAAAPTAVVAQKQD